MRFEKLFFLGMNKTGTNTWSVALRESGLKVKHAARWVDSVRVPGPTKFDKFDAFSDGECANIPAILRKYPNAGFVLQSRPLERWLISRHYSVARSQWVAKWFQRKYFGFDSILGPAIEWLIRNDDDAMSRWVRIRNTYHRHVVDTLDGTDRLLVSDLALEGDDAYGRLGAFLEREVPIVPKYNVGGQDTITGHLVNALSKTRVESKKRRGMPRRARVPTRQDSETAVAEFLDRTGLRQHADVSLVIDDPAWMLPPSGMDRITAIAPFLRGPQSRFVDALCRQRAVTKGEMPTFFLDVLLRIVRSHTDMDRYTSVRQIAGGSR